MRAAVLVILAFVLGACVTRDASVQLTAPPQTSGAWKIEQRVDRISGESAPVAFIVTSRTTYTRTNNFYAAGLELACFNKHPVIRLVFGFRIGSNRNSTVAYRFDEKPGRDAVATILADHKTIVIDNQAEVSRLWKSLRVRTCCWCASTRCSPGVPRRNSASRARRRQSRPSLPDVPGRMRPSAQPDVRP